VVTGSIPPDAPGSGPHAGIAALLALAGFSLLEGVGLAVSGHDPRVSGLLALAVGAVLYALALVGRLLRRWPEVRSVMAVVASLFIAAGVVGLGQGAPSGLLVALAGAVVIGLAALAARRIPSAVAAALAVLGVIVIPAVLIAIAGAGLLAAAVAGTVALALVVLAGHGVPRSAHPAGRRWMIGTSAVAGALVVTVLTAVVGGVAVGAAAVGAAGLCMAAERRRSIALGLAAFVMLSVTLAEAVRSGGNNPGSNATLLILGAVVLAGVAMAAGLFSRRTLVLSGGPRLPLSVEDLVIALAAVLTLASATGTVGAGFGGPTPFSIFGSGSSSSSSSSGGPFQVVPAPTFGSGYIPCPSAPPGFTLPPEFTPPPGVRDVLRGARPRRGDGHRPLRPPPATR